MLPKGRVGLSRSVLGSCVYPYSMDNRSIIGHQDQWYSSVMVQ